ncbi:hypothetical protein EVJ58_g10762 [Rhodofomes roseus]|uniref:DUF6589 domain-containing protein n=1 Tax=Rhodofomes roseus TaxID=34475 RepID=A0A4Y9XL97_9APHY|nr:hypothetical protein EVJ58_g10762 [Rhodofomes roseus]
MMSIYFRGCGIATVAFNTLNAFGFCMNQKWVYDAVSHIGETAHNSLRKDISAYPWFGSHDNLNRKHTAHEQRLDNQRTFESGTAGTIYVIKDPAVIRPDPLAVRTQMRMASRERLSALDILMKDDEASPRITEHLLHHVISVLTEAATFDFASYSFADDPLFQAPKPRIQLPTGPEHATVSYLLNTVKIEEASYEGNVKVMREWERQLGFDKPGEKQRLAQNTTLVWIGDQLTVSRLRGIQRFRCEDDNAYERLEHIVTQFGWFHGVVALLHSYHSEYYGTTSGRGLAFAIELLGRRNLKNTSVQGLFTHDMDELLSHVGVASLRDVWCTVAKVSCLSELRTRTPVELKALALHVVKDFASTQAMFNRDVLEYFIIRDAIKSGDVGTLEDMLPRLFFRFAGGRSPNYRDEVIGLMHSMCCEWTPALKDYVMKYCWLANTTGRPDSFLPFDQLQEHNVRDLKYTFESLGPHATWELLGRMSAAIPCLRQLKDHIEAQFNHYFRGKSHTTPAAEDDITKLSQAFHDSKVHLHVPGRIAKNKLANFVGDGCDTIKMDKDIDSFYDRRECERATGEVYDSE